MDVHTLGILAEEEGGGAHNTAVVVRRLNAFLSVPGDVVLVGQDGGQKGGAVVAAEADHHEAEECPCELMLGMKRARKRSSLPSLRHLTLGLELVGDRVGLHVVLAIGDLDEGLGLDVGGGDVLFGVLDVVRVDFNSVEAAARSGGIDGSRGGAVSVRWGRHVW